MLPSLRLKKHEEKRLKQGHVWVYSNEIATTHTPLSSFYPGQLVQIEDTHAAPLGVGYINPHTLLCARLLTRDIAVSIDIAFFQSHIQRALALRETLFEKPFYRLIYGEADALPGVIVDRYGAHLVVQITTAGMELQKDALCTALETVLKPRSILWRNDHSMRATEGLPSYIEAAFGDPPADIEMEENGVQFLISPWTGQKTGWFYDHRDNRAQLARYVKGKRVLDLFSYLGGWSVQAAVYGAREVWAVDASAEALQRLTQNAKINQVEEKIRVFKADAFAQLKIFSENKEYFDVIILDPPAFIKKRKDQKEGLLAYKRINEMAMRLLHPNGFFISASCSQSLSCEDLSALVFSAALKNKRAIQILAKSGQGPDHPIHPAIPETAYLKTVFFHG
jgi:23S rRNA (cytosine1962-C5)-methyltransferase